MSDMQSLLPRNASPLERSLEAGLTQRSARLDAEAPARFRRPATVPEAHLPFLGWEVDVPLWKNLSTEERRALSAQSPDLHRLAGTLSGARRLAAWAGGRVVHAITRRNRAFAGASLSAGEREEWLTRLPELRVYTFRQRGHARPCASLLQRVHPLRRFAVPSTARARFFERATRVRGGIETELSVWTLESSTTTGQGETTRRIAMPSRARGAWRYPQGILRRSSSQSRLYSVTDQASYQQTGWTLAARILPVPDGLNPVTLGMEHIAMPGFGNRTRYPNALLRGQALTPSTAAGRLYRRARLTDPSVPPAARARGAYMTRGRLSPPAWRAELLTELRGSPRRGARYLQGNLPAHNPAPLENLQYAIEWGRPAAAEWRIDTRTRVRKYANIQHLAGAVRAGETSPAR